MCPHLLMPCECGQAIIGPQTLDATSKAVQAQRSGAQTGDLMDEHDSSQESPNPLIGEHTGAVTRFEAAAAGADTGTDQDRRGLPDRLCRALLQVLPVDGAAISVYLGADISVPVGASDENAARAEALQFTLREGPCLTSYTSRRPVAIPDIDQPRSRARTLWPTYTAELTRHTPYRSAFAYPLLVSSTAMGCLTVYGRTPGGPGALSDLTAISTLITTSMLHAEIFARLHGETEHPWIDGPTTTARKQVWFAQGLIMKANRVDPTQSLQLLRAHAYTAGRLIDAVAADIATGQLPIPLLSSNH
jgi:hypothetical protein